jgi:hypothetical protein
MSSADALFMTAHAISPWSDDPQLASVDGRPASVSTTKALRRCVVRSSRATRPRRCLRTRWWDSRLCSHCRSSATSNPRSRPRPIL